MSRLKTTAKNAKTKCKKEPCSLWTPSGQLSEVAPDENAVYIGNTEEIPYAKYQEFGTSKMKAHPYLKPAATGSKADIHHIMQAAYKSDEASFLSQLIAAFKAGAKIGKKASKKFEDFNDKMQK